MTHIHVHFESESRNERRTEAVVPNLARQPGTLATAVYTGLGKQVAPAGPRSAVEVARGNDLRPNDPRPQEVAGTETLPAWMASRYAAWSRALTSAYASAKSAIAPSNLSLMPR